MFFPLPPVSSLALREARRPRVLGALLLGGALVLSPAAQAQKAPKTAAPTAAAIAAPAPLPNAPDIGILLLAIDDLPAPGGVTALPPPPTAAIAGPILPVPGPGAIVPAAPLPGAPLAPAAPGVITPAMLRPLNRAFWMAQAQRKKKPDPDADLFKLEPDYSHLGVPAPPKPPAAGAAQPAAPLTATDTSTASEPLGRSHAAAITVRRALLALGYRDVSVATPDATLGNNASAERLLSEALTDHRLTPRAFQALRGAFADIAAAGAIPTREATERATIAATRIGQALGYRAVAAFHLAAPTTQNGAQSAAFSVFLADSSRESGEPILFDEGGANERALSETGASTAAALLDKTLRTWPDAVPSQRLDLAAKHLAGARSRIATGDTAGAQDELNQAIALDPSKSEPLVLLGDLLSTSDPTAAASAYRRAVELDARDGQTLAKIAIAYASAATPDWPRALDAGRKALAAGFDSAALRVAMATAQYGRADLFRQADRQSRADDAELDARTHLDRALELSPDDPSAVRLLAARLVDSRRFSEATQTLDRVAPHYPNDLEIQTQYAAALAGQTGREEDAFVATAHVWKLQNLTRADADGPQYRALAQGFDARLYNIGKSAVQLTTGVANAALPREDALIQLTKLKEDMADAENAITILHAPASVGLEGVAARQFAATLMTQALEQEQIYLETGQSLARLRGSTLYTQAVAQLNAARAAR